MRVGGELTGQRSVVGAFVGHPAGGEFDQIRAQVDREFWEFEVTGVLGPELTKEAKERADA